MATRAEKLASQVNNTTIMDKPRPEYTERPPTVLEDVLFRMSSALRSCIFADYELLMKTPPKEVQERLRTKRYEAGDNQQGEEWDNAKTYAASCRQAHTEAMRELAASIRDPNWTRPT